MKNYLLLFALVAIAFVGCDKLKQQTFGARFIHNFTIDIDENSGTTQFNLEEQLNALTNGEIESVKESIVSYNVKNIMWKVWEYAGPETATVQGTVELRSLSGSLLYEYSIEESNLLELNDDENYTNFPMTQDQKDVIVQALLSDNEIRVLAQGETSEVPVHFVLQVVADITATAEVD